VHLETVSDFVGFSQNCYFNIYVVVVIVVSCQSKLHKLSIKGSVSQPLVPELTFPL